MANISDDFNRADSSSTLGGSWSALIGTWGILSNKAYYVTADYGNAAAVLDSGTSDVEVQATFSTIVDYSGIVVRATDANNFIDMQIAGGGSVTVNKKDAGSFSTLGTVGSISFSHGDVYKVKASGTTIEVYQNGGLILTVLGVTFNQTATLHGLFENSGLARLDDFSVTDVGGGGGEHPDVAAAPR